jgi:hypothetical protein
MDIAYTAHTETCTLLLDAEGICRSVLAVSSRVASNGGARPTRIPSSAEKCVGAQYVATLDLKAPGGMAAMPQVGAQMLFARTEKNGRITLVRSAPVVRFEATPAKAESGVHARPDDSATVPAVRSPDATYDDDEELTLPCDPPTIAGRNRRSSLPPPPPSTPRNSGVVPAGTVARSTPIPPPPRAPRVEPPPDSLTRPRYTAPPTYPPPSGRAPAPSLPKRPSLVRVSAPAWDLETRPFKRAAR